MAIVILVIIIIAIFALSCKGNRRKKVPITSYPEAVYETPINSDPIYEVPVGTEDVEVNMQPSVAYGVSTFGGQPENMTKNEAYILHTREDKNHYSNYEKNEESIYENEEPRRENDYEQSHYYI